MKMQSPLHLLLQSDQESNFTDSGPFPSTVQNETDWGPKRDPLPIVVTMSAVYVTIFLSGVIGNISTCVVIARNRSMHTATNYYLFSLAISDLLLLISGLPPEIYSIWSKYPYIFGEEFCVLQGFAAETSANATVLTITAFTVERYVAICHPFLSHTLSKLNRAIKYIILIWVIAMSLAIPQAMAFGIVCEELSDGRVIDEHCICNIKRSVIPYAFEISTMVFFVVPMSLITVLYIFIGLQLHRSTVEPSRGNSVRMKHRVYKPVVTYANSATQVSMVNGTEGSQHEDDGRKNFAKTAQATKHVVKMLAHEDIQKTLTSRTTIAKYKNYKIHKSKNGFQHGRRSDNAPRIELAKFALRKQRPRNRKGEKERVFQFLKRSVGINYPNTKLILFALDERFAEEFNIK